MAAKQFYVGTDKNGVIHKIEKFVNPILDGTKLVKNAPAIYDVKKVARKLKSDDFDNYIFESIPQDVKDRIDSVVVDAEILANKGLADKLPENKHLLRRAIYLSWLHSRDIQLIMKAMGYSKSLEGVHDIEEYVLGIRLKESLKSASEWYLNYVTSLGDDEKVNIGFLNPHLTSSMYNWGTDKTGIQNAMDAHRLSSHHLGTPEAPIDYVERSVNFVLHHLPRENYGIRHEPQGDWINLEEKLSSDPSTKHDEIIQIIARDAAIIMKNLEEEGKITPWQLLDTSTTRSVDFTIENYSTDSPTILRNIELEGIVKFNPVNNKWSISGSVGWYVGEVSEGEPISVKINFFENIELGYSVHFTPVSEGTTIIKDIECSYVGEEGFRIYIDTLNDFVTGIIGFSFIVKGKKQQVVPDDKSLSKDELIEDIHSISNTLRNEAEFGMVTVMSSASINDKPSVQREIQRRIGERKQKEVELSNLVFEEEKKHVREEIERIDHRLQRLNILEINSKYWDSAYRFGQMWGLYAKNKQKAELGGKYIPICTGGGPGIMAAVAKGASEQKTQVIGIDCIFGNDKRYDLTDDFSLFSNVRLRCNDFAIREGALINYSHVILFWPGGYGTLWEAFETLSKIQTHHLRRKKVKAIFVHDEFWMPMYHLVKHLEASGTINSLDDRIKIKGIDNSKPDEYYVAEFVKDENEAFEATIRHLKNLQSQNMLSLK
ncbi:MAG: LOG family protein [bacterium]|nr:LOG family protein [bacterium]